MTRTTYGPSMWFAAASTQRFTRTDVLLAALFVAIVGGALWCGFLAQVMKSEQGDSPVSPKAIQYLPEETK